MLPAIMAVRVVGGSASNFSLSWSIGPGSGSPFLRFFFFGGAGFAGSSLRAGGSLAGFGGASDPATGVAIASGIGKVLGVAPLAAGSCRKDTVPAACCLRRCIAASNAFCASCAERFAFRISSLSSSLMVKLHDLSVLERLQYTRILQQLQGETALDWRVVCYLRPVEDFGMASRVAGNFDKCRCAEAIIASRFNDR